MCTLTPLAKELQPLDVRRGRVAESSTSAIGAKLGASGKTPASYDGRNTQHTTITPHHRTTAAGHSAIRFEGATKALNQS